VTAHLVIVEGAVAVFPDAPHDVRARQLARNEEIPSKTADRDIVDDVTISETAGIAATAEPVCLQDPYQRGSRSEAPALYSTYNLTPEPTRFSKEQCGGEPSVPITLGAPGTRNDLRGPTRG
jgi:hypothetical protein